MHVDLDIEGLAELRQALRDLPNAAQQRVVRPSMRAAARVFADRTKDATPIGPSGNLRRAGGYVRQSRDPGPYQVAYKAGYRARLGAHALIVDQGSGPRRTKRGANRGAAPAQRFFDRAVIAAGNSAMAMLRAHWSVRLAIEARRYARGQLTARGTIRPQFRRTGRR